MGSRNSLEKAIFTPKAAVKAPGGGRVKPVVTKGLYQLYLEQFGWKNSFQKKWRDKA